ncbi:hypothetical protein [Shewanella sp.]|uniref:hypothetical protein n=1 Tax=Shewanella sp. TaxID=50422 RepID=UPI0035682F1E
MSQIEQVLIVARMLEEKGQEPSTALIKANLPRPMPLPAIVKGLQLFKNLSAEEKARLQPPAAVAPTATEPTDELELLKLKVNQLEQLCHSLSERLQRLEGSQN